MWLQGDRGYVNQVLESPISYEAWIKLFEPPVIVPLDHHSPAFDLLLLPDADTDTDLDPLLNSLNRQTYPHWRLLLVGKHGIATDDRIVAFDTLESAISAITADYVMLLTPGTWLAEWTLSSFASVTADDPDIVYCDADDTHRENPFFKPDWSPELMLSINLLAEAVVRRELLLEHVQVLPNQWDFGLRLTETATNIRHIPQVLVHRHPGKPDPEAVYRYLLRQGMQNPEVTLVDGRIRCIWQPRHMGMISIIIPSRDKASLLEQCLDSIFEITDYPNFEVIIVDTGSVEVETQQLYERYHGRIQVMEYHGTFNFGRACNVGAEKAQGDYLLFLNNDTEVLHADWLMRMVQWFDQEHVGVVGAKLLFPDGRIQHAGVLVGVYGMADNLLTLSPENYAGPYGSDQWYRNLLAVTGACVMVRRDLFQQVGGFSEAYVLVFSDVILCLDIHVLGYRIIYSPDVRLIHHESATRSRDQSAIPENDLKLAAEHLKPWIKTGDPYFSRNLSYRNVIPTFRIEVNDTPSRRPYETTKREMQRPKLSTPEKSP